MAKKKDVPDDGRRLPIHVYDQMFEAFLINPDPQHVAEVSGVNLVTVNKYIEKGDPRRGLPSLASRLKDAKATTRSLNKNVMRNILQKRAEQKSALSDMMYAAMVDRDTHTLINPAHADPKNFILMTKDEFESHQALQDRIDEETAVAKSGGERIDFEDPAVRAKLKRKFISIKQEAIVATLRTVVGLLDPDGARGIRRELPPNLRRALEADDVIDVTADTIPNG